MVFFIYSRAAPCRPPPATHRHHTEPVIVRFTRTEIHTNRPQCRYTAVGVSSRKVVGIFLGSEKLVVGTRARRLGPARSMAVGRSAPRSGHPIRTAPAARVSVCSRGFHCATSGHAPGFGCVGARGPNSRKTVCHYQKTLANVSQFAFKLFNSRIQV